MPAASMTLQALLRQQGARTSDWARVLATGALVAGAWAMSVALAPAQARDVYFSIGVQAPGVSVGVSNAPPVVYHPPVVVHYPPPVVHYRPPVVHYPPAVVVHPAPVYYHPRPVVVYSQPAVPIGRPVVVVPQPVYHERPRHPGHRHGHHKGDRHHKHHGPHYRY
ncbi:MAG TPA: hypothetical protein PKC60_08815 [Hydrogenophaga sp.]|mgnify:CR=1 FL=1|uniref:hypothetical protein n=1 Tax=Hydrogenophaga sp. TaxID=1904254 RepID=UPI002D0B0BCA|nr:hypothetical protein [Hydrogenophaga sp.]HMN93321.1 hypothetical protein [Hydrogenophaga sp.]HMP10684.1 hypothetical protein [Hydrogenophaga sp.]